MSRGSFFKIIFLVFIVFCLPLIAIPAQAQNFGSEDLTTVGQAAGYGEATLPQLIGRVIKIILGLLGLVGLIIIIIGGFLWMTSNGAPEKIQKAKKIMVNGLIGFLIIVFAYTIVSFIIGKLVDISEPVDPNITGCTPGLCCSTGWRCSSDEICNILDSGCSLPPNAFKIRKIETSHDGTELNYHQNVHLCSAVQPIFNNSIDQEKIQELTANGDLKIETGSSQVVGDWQTRNNTLIFKHNNLFSENTSYQAYFPKSILNTQGKMLQECLASGSCQTTSFYFIWNFTTGTTVDEIAPEIISTYPINSSAIDYPDTNVSRYPNIEINFSEPIDLTSVADENSRPLEEKIWLAEISGQGGEVIQNVPVENLKIVSNGNGFRIILNEISLNAFSWYRIHIEGVEDLCLNQMQGFKEWEFQTNGQVPGISSYYPNGNKVCPDSKMSVVFNTQMYDNLVRFKITGGDNFNFELRPSELVTPFEIEVVGGIFKVEDFGDPINNHFRVFSFIPNQNLKANKNYEIEVLTDLIINQQGELLKGTWSFKTANLEDCLCSPWISYLSPAEGLNGECLTLQGQCFTGTNFQPAEPSKIEFKFNENIYQAEIGGFNSNYITTSVPNFFSQGNRPMIQATIKYSENQQELSGNEAEFFIKNDGQAQGPCLWSLSPNAGYANETKINLSGARFGGQNTLSNVLFFEDKFATFEQWTEQKIKNVLVPLGTESGLVYVANSAGISNGLPFNSLKRINPSGEICQHSIQCPLNPPYQCAGPAYQCLSKADDTCRCCCIPEPNSCLAGLECMVGQGNCSGENRGLCCGCENDFQCGGSGLGCGFLDNNRCCYPRPIIVNAGPQGGNICLNTSLEINFNQAMDENSLNKNNIKLTKLPILEVSKIGRDYFEVQNNSCLLESAVYTGSCENNLWTYQISAPLEGSYQLYLKTSNYSESVKNLGEDAVCSDAGVQHHIKVLIDGEEKGEICADALLEIQISKISLGLLTQGNHNIELVWDNNWFEDGKGDSNLRIYQIDLRRQVAESQNDFEISINGAKDKIVLFPTNCLLEPITDYQLKLIGGINGEGIRSDKGVSINSYLYQFSTGQSDNICETDSIVVDPIQATVNSFNEDETYTAVGYDSNDNPLCLLGFNWNSANVNIASIDREYGLKTIASPVGGQGEQTTFIIASNADLTGNGLFTSILNPPIIESLSPEQGTNNPAFPTYVTIRGSDFGDSKGNSKVKFGDLEAAIGCENWSDNEIIAIVPKDLLIGEDYPVSIENSEQGISNEAIFKVRNEFHPAICILNPNQEKPGKNIFIQGFNFGNEQGTGYVLFKENEITSQQIEDFGSNWSDKKIKVIIPEMESNNAQVSVYAPSPIEPNGLLKQSNQVSFYKKLVLPQVVEYNNCSSIITASPLPMPLSNQVCSNAMFSARFNKKVVGLNLENIIVKKCNSGLENFKQESCLIEVEGNIILTGFQEKGFIFNPASLLTENYWYQITLKSGLTGIKDLENNSLDGNKNNLIDVGLLDDYSWHFKIKSEQAVCSPKSVTILETNLVGETAGLIKHSGTKNYYAVAMGENCQILRPSNFDWNWTSEIPGVAIISRGIPPYSASATSLGAGQTKIKTEVSLIDASDEKSEGEILLTVTTPPAILNYQPTGNEVCRNALIKVGFDQLMDKFSFSQDTIKFEKKNSFNIWEDITSSIRIGLFNSDGKTELRIQAGLLQANQEYKIRVSGGGTGVKNLFSLGMSADREWGFTTKELCQLSEVEINPREIDFNRLNQSINLLAKTFDSQRQEIIPVADYFWTWEWDISNEDSVSFSPLQDNSSSQVLLSKANGLSNVSAKAIPNFGKPIINSALARVFACDFPWSFKDTQGPVLAPNTNFSLRYCQGNLSQASEDFLPLITSPAVLNGQAELVKEFLFSIPGGGDAIGLKIFNNPEHLSPLLWYQNAFPNYGQTNSLLVDGYQAIKEGRSIYVAATNLKDNEVYSYIYLLSYNDKAQEKTIEIFNQLIKNWEFNTNLSDLIENKLKLQRDLLRIQNLMTIGEYLDKYKENQEFYPALDAGTFILGKTNSLWPSWQNTLGSALGKTLPIDPINKFNGPCSGCEDEPDYQCQNTCYYQPAKLFEASNGSHFYQYSSPQDVAIDCHGSYYVLKANLEYGEENIIWKGGEVSAKGITIDDFIVENDDVLGTYNYIYQSTGRPICGNGIQECGEQCDCNENGQNCCVPETSGFCPSTGLIFGQFLNPNINCSYFGMAGGILKCLDCSWDISSCQKKANGANCSFNADCNSNFCVDNVCCDRSCDGLCEYCGGGYGFEKGVCGGVSVGNDPRNDCLVINGCDTGFCDGVGACGDYRDNNKHSCEQCQICNHSGECQAQEATGQSAIDLGCQAPANALAYCDLNGCSWECLFGYHQVGNGCVMNSCSGTVPTIDCPMANGIGKKSALCDISVSPSVWSTSEFGNCEIVSCNLGWSNCVNGATDGCETNSATIDNCGSCGNICNLGDLGCRYCDNGICKYYVSGQHSCSTNYVCNSEGACVDTCDCDGGQCCSNWCNYDADNSDCGSCGDCLTGVCLNDKKALSVACSSASECCSNNCSGGYCVSSSADCTPGATSNDCTPCGTKTCQTNGLWGTCLNVKKALSIACSSASECCSNNCSSGYCVSSSADCTPGATSSDCLPCGTKTCQTNGFWGTCQSVKKALGVACSSSPECCSNNCSGGYCVSSSADCTPGATSNDCTPCGTKTCQTNGFWGICPSKLSNGEICSLSSDCCSGNCLNEFCVVSEPQCTPEITPPTGCEKCGIKNCLGTGLWGVCYGQKDCEPGDTQECVDANENIGEMTCLDECVWPGIDDCILDCDCAEGDVCCSDNCHYDANGNSCSIFNYLGTCQSETGNCVYSSCQPNYLNCDNNLINGCEIDKNTNSDYCGNCVTSCSTTNCGTGNCYNGVCLYYNDGAKHNCPNGQGCSLTGQCILPVTNAPSNFEPYLKSDGLGNYFHAKWQDNSNNEDVFKIEWNYMRDDNWKYDEWATESFEANSESGTLTILFMSNTMDKDFYFKIKACNIVGCSDYSEESVRTTLALVTQTSGYYEHPKKNKLTWQYNGRAPINGFKIGYYEMPIGSDFWGQAKHIYLDNLDFTKTTYNYIHSDVNVNKKYIYFIRACLSENNCPSLGDPSFVYITTQPN